MYQVSDICGKGSKSSKIRIANVSKMILKFFFEKKIQKKNQPIRRLEFQIQFSSSKWVSKEQAWLTESRTGLGLTIGQLVLEKFEYESCEFCKNDPFSYFFAIFSVCKPCAQKRLLTSGSDKLKKIKMHNLEALKIHFPNIHLTRYTLVWEMYIFLFLK